MTDLFKSNPMALRHCLLYEFLQGNPIEHAFTALHMTIGTDVFKNEELQFWFDMFDQGVFDMEDDKESITDMRDVLRSDKYALRSCILYESLKYKIAERGHATRFLWPKSKLTIYEIKSNPSFAMYNIFRKVIGKDVMEYQEFDFWFYRFFNGKYDLNFEREKDKKIYELMDMPIDVMANIVEYLDIFERLNLAKASRSLQTFVENQKLSHHTSKLSIFDFVATVSLSDPVNIEYLWDSVGCKKIFKRRETLVRGVHYWKQALLDFKGILKNPKLCLDTLKIGLYANDEHVLKDVKDELKFTQYLNVENLIIVEYSWELLAKIVPMLKPGYLTRIDLFSTNPNEDSMRKVFEMEQWKQAKYFKIDGDYFIWSLRHLYHFVVFEVRLEEMSVEDVHEMKEVLFKSPNFEKCLILVDDDTGAKAVEEEFGDYIRQVEIYSEYMKIYHYPTPNSTEYFEIYVEGSHIAIKRKKR